MLFLGSLVFLFTSFFQDSEATGVQQVLQAIQNQPSQAQVEPALGVVFRSHDFNPHDEFIPPSFKTPIKFSDFFPLDKSKHAGIKYALQAVKPVPSIVPGDPRKLWLRFYVYVHDDSHTWAEVALCNDSMEDPIGFLYGDFIIYFQGKPVAFRKNAELYDQTGAVLLLGEPRLAPISDLIKEVQANFPKNIQFSFDTGYYSLLGQWGNPDPRGEDHIPWTHQTGSPRNMYWSWEMDGVWQYWYVHPPEKGSRLWLWVHRLSVPIVQFAHEQFGTWHIGEEGVPVFHQGRTYHLARYEEGNPVEIYDARKTYSYDNEQAYYAYTGEGVIQTKHSRNMPEGAKIETFGRKNIPIYHVTDKSVEGVNEKWLLHRLSGLGYKGQQAVGGPYWGWDYEHATNERLFTAAVCTPSEIARLEIINLANTMMRGSAENGNAFDYNGCWQTGFDHSSRAYGWTGRLFWRTYKITGETIYRDICRAMLDLWVTEVNGYRRLEIVNGWPPIHKEAMTPFALTREANAAAGMWNSGQDPVEASWQASVAAMFFWLMYDEESDPTYKSKAKQAALEICDGIIQCIVPGKGLYENYGIRFKSTEGKPLLLSGDVTWQSTRHWCLDALAKAWAESDNKAKFEVARLGWLSDFLERTRYPFYDPGREYGHKWHRYCALYWGWTK